jgi:hypothetical protein
MKKVFCVLAVIIALTVTSAFAQIPFLGGMPVFDATNFGNAVKRHFELVRQYEQLVLTYEQLILEYEHFLYMAQRLPILTRHRLGWTPWRFSRSANTYGTTGAWTSAVNTGTGVESGYRLATEPLKVFGGALGRIPANQIERIKTDYATVELADAANLHGMEVIGSQRAKAPSAEEAIQALESASLSTDDRMNTHIAVLNKINAAGMMAVRASQDTNQLLVTLAEQQIADSKRRRDAEAAEITDQIAFQASAALVARRGIQGTTLVLSSLQIR